MGVTHDHTAHGQRFRTASGRHRGRLVWVLAITGAIVAVQIVGAIVSGSVALLADAGHLLSDTAGVALALFAIALAARPATAKRTFGLVRAEILAAALNAAILLALGVYVLYEGIGRITRPEAVEADAMLLFGAIGLVGNLASMLVLARVQKESLNLRGAYLEVLMDTLSSVGVIVAALVVRFTGFTRADAIVAIVIGALIVPRALRLLKAAVDVLLEATPQGIDIEEIREHLLGVQHVRGVHDLHAWTLTSGMPVLSAHVVVEDGCFRDGHAPQMLDALQACVAGHFDVEHSTFQLEPESHLHHEPRTTCVA